MAKSEEIGGLFRQEFGYARHETCHGHASACDVPMRRQSPLCPPKRAESALINGVLLRVLGSPHSPCRRGEPANCNAPDKQELEPAKQGWRSPVWTSRQRLMDRRDCRGRYRPMVKASVNVYSLAGMNRAESWSAVSVTSRVPKAGSRFFPDQVAKYPASESLLSTL
jgi:hypothetical protein